MSFSFLVILKKVLMLDFSGCCPNVTTVQFRADYTNWLLFKKPPSFSLSLPLTVVGKFLGDGEEKGEGANECNERGERGAVVWERKGVKWNNVFLPEGVIVVFQVVS